MAATNTTPNLELSQFVGSDKPDWLTDYNGDMSKIDSSYGAVDALAQAANSAAEAAAASATQAAADAASALAGISGAIDAANAATAAAEQATSVSNSALSVANGAAATAQSAAADAQQALAVANNAKVTAENAQAAAAQAVTDAQSAAADAQSASAAATQAATDAAAAAAIAAASKIFVPDVTVTALQNENYRTVLSRLFNELDTTKITPKTMLRVKYAGYSIACECSKITIDEPPNIQFSASTLTISSGNARHEFSIFELKTSGSSYIRHDITNTTVANNDLSTSTPGSGTIFEIMY